MLPFRGFPAAVPKDGLGVPEAWGCGETIDDITVTGGHGCREVRSTKFYTMPAAYAERVVLSLWIRW
jgi:hypothetical protein